MFGRNLVDLCAIAIPKGCSSLLDVSQQLLMSRKVLLLIGCDGCVPIGSVAKHCLIKLCEYLLLWE